MTSLRDDLLAQHRLHRIHEQFWPNSVRIVMALWDHGWYCALSVASPPLCIADVAIWPFWNPQTGQVASAGAARTSPCIPTH